MININIFSILSIVSHTSEIEIHSGIVPWFPSIDSEFNYLHCCF